MTADFDFSSLAIQTKFIGHKKDSSKWDYFEWEVTLPGGWTFPFYTGRGYVSPNGTPSIPTAETIIYSLFQDAKAANMSFNAWCSKHGCSNDSISAFNTYQGCCEISELLKKSFSITQLEKMKETLFKF